MLEFVAALRENRYKTGLLSNTEPPALSFFADDVKRHFDSFTFSCAVGAIKPERKIYMHSLELLGVDAPNAVYIDDIAEYVEGASAAGMNAIQYVSEERLKEELAGLRVRV